VSVVNDNSASHLEALSALQAHLLLSIYAYTNIIRFPDIFTVDMISTLQELASKVSASGLVCPEELTASTIPSWESWIIAESKRRTVYCVYYLENLYNSDRDAASYIGEELGLLPAPCTKWLWHAENRSVWETEFGEWLKYLNRRRGVVLAEFWPRPSAATGGVEGIDNSLQSEREERLSAWTEGADEYGMLLLSVCVSSYNI
jgi:hypothetical protein